MEYNKFAEGLRRLNEMAHMEKGHADVKAIIVEGEVDYGSSVIREYTDKGYRIVDENMFGDGTSRIGTIVVFAKD